MHGQRVIITGGGSGIGLATAQEVVRRGGEVVLLGRSQDRLEQAQATLEGRANIAVLDVTQEVQVQGFFEGVGPFDHLVTAAGPQAGDRPLLELDSNFARNLFESKYWGQFHAAKYGALRLRSGGSITLFSAWLARRPTAGFSTFAAVDGAIEALARVIALELAPVRVNVVSPGIIDTPLWNSFSLEAKTGVFESFGAKLPVGRVGTAQDVAGAVLYLMSNGFSTGAVVDVDGGHFF